MARHLQVSSPSEGLGRKLPAGVVDSSLASLATFAVALSATRLYSASELGVYAIFFSAFLLAAVIPTEVLFTPVHVEMMTLQPAHRLPVLRRSVPMGGVAAAPGLAVILIAGLVASSHAPPDFVVSMMLTCGVAGFLSPIQDHVRKVFHLAEQSWRAALLSLCQVGFVGLGLVGSDRFGVSHEWIPFGALAIANLASLALGMFMIKNHDESHLLLPWRKLVKAGRWVLLSALATTGSAFLAVSIMSELVSAEVVGYAEAARVASQPIAVLAFGLSSALSARHMSAATARDLTSARSNTRLFQVLTGAAAIGWLLVAGLPWDGNPMKLLIPGAYEVEGLVAATVVAMAITNSLYPARTQLIAGRYEVEVGRVDLLSIVPPVLVALAAPFISAFARPLGVASQGLARWIGYRRWWRDLYHGSESRFGRDKSARR